MVIIAGLLYTLVVDSNLFSWFDIIVDEHFFAAHNGHFSDFVRIKPARLNEPKDVIWKRHGEYGNIFYCRINVRRANRGN